MRELVLVSHNMAKPPPLMYFLYFIQHSNECSLRKLLYKLSFFFCLFFFFSKFLRDFKHPKQAVYADWDRSNTSLSCILRHPWAPLSKFFELTAFGVHTNLQGCSLLLLEALPPTINGNIQFAQKRKSKNSHTKKNS